MAASRVPLLGVDQLRAGLDERLRLLKADRHLGETRHRTLRDTVEWSHGLLDQSDSGCSAVLPSSPARSPSMLPSRVRGGGCDRWDIVDILGRLTNKSLLTLDPGERPRYRLLETLRLFARER
ncbi:MAG: hypothetical protein WDN69_37450 [Aliidongia sp.]